MTPRERVRSARELGQRGGAFRQCRGAHLQLQNAIFIPRGYAASMAGLVSLDGWSSRLRWSVLQLSISRHPSRVERPSTSRAPARPAIDSAPTPFDPETASASAPWAECDNKNTRELRLVVAFVGGDHEHARPIDRAVRDRRAEKPTQSRPVAGNVRRASNDRGVAVRRDRSQSRSTESITGGGGRPTSDAIVRSVARGIGCCGCRPSRSCGIRRRPRLASPRRVARLREKDA